MEKALLVVGASSDMGLATIKALENDYDLIIGHYRTTVSYTHLVTHGAGQSARRFFLSERYFCAILISYERGS